MELLQLKYFCDAAESENFSKTAQKYSVPTSNISQTVKRLECELGVKLFVRTSNKICLSEEGRVFYSGVKCALSALDGAVGSLSDCKDEVRGEIKLLICVHRRPVALAIEKFKALHPNVQIIINHDAESAYSDYDFIISDGAERRALYSRELLLREKIVLAAASNHPKYTRKYIPLSELSDENFITMTNNSRLAQLSHALCRSVGFIPNTVISAEDPYYVRKYVEMGLGVALVPSISWRGLFSDNTKLIDVGEYYREIFLYVSDYKILSKTESCVQIFPVWKQP